MTHRQSSRMGPILRRKLEDTKPMDTSGVERGTRSPQLSTPSLRSAQFKPSPMGSPAIGSSPIQSSPVRTPEQENEPGGERANRKRPRLTKGFGKGTFRGLTKGRDNGE